MASQLVVTHYGFQHEDKKSNRATRAYRRCEEVVCDGPDPAFLGALDQGRGGHPSEGVLLAQGTVL